MALERTLQFRVSKEMERELRTDATTLGLTESEALRHALGLLHRVAKRQRNVGTLVGQATIRGTGADEATGFR